MSRGLHKLSARAVAALASPGRYSDGGGLYVVVSPGGASKWVFRFAMDGRSTDMGLGSTRDVSLKDARDLAQDARRQLALGLNPLKARQDARNAKRAKPTFGETAEAVVASLTEGFRNYKHKAQWRATLGLISTNSARISIAPRAQSEHEAALQRMRSKPVDQVDTSDVVAVLKPIWNLKPETASRLRGRIERVLDAARAEGHIHADRANPARWRGHLDKLLSKPNKLSRGHHAALAFQHCPAFFKQLQSQQAVAALALTFTILTATRSNEVLGAQWSEIDLEAPIWTIPKHRMKAGREHRVPLNDGAVEILGRLAQTGTDGFVFPGSREDRPLSVMAMTMVLRRMKHSDITVHGFRSSFRDWAAECTTYQNEVCEAALAHVVGDKVEAAYRRGDLFEKRRNLMTDWEAYLRQRNKAAIPETRDEPASSSTREAV